MLILNVPLFDAISAEFLPRLSSYSSPDISLTVWAFAKLG